MARAIDPQRRETILSAARAELREQGYTATRMAAIAARAGVAAGTIYRYFPSKDALVVALGARFFDQVWAIVHTTLGETLTPVSIAAFVRQLFTLAAEEHDILRLRQLSSGLQGPRAEEIRAPYNQFLQKFAGLLERHLQGDRMQPYEDSFVLAELLTGIFEWVSTVTLLRRQNDLAHYETTLITFCTHALIPRHMHESSVGDTYVD